MPDVARRPSDQQRTQLYSRTTPSQTQRLPEPVVRQCVSSDGSRSPRLQVCAPRGADSDPPAGHTTTSTTNPRRPSAATAVSIPITYAAHQHHRIALAGRPNPNKNPAPEAFLILVEVPANNLHCCRASRSRVGTVTPPTGDMAPHPGCDSCPANGCDGQLDHRDRRQRRPPATVVATVDPCHACCRCMDNEHAPKV